MMKYSLLFVLTFIGTAVFGQSFYDLNTIQTIKITFAESNWDQLLDDEKATTEEYIMAQSVEINGNVFDSVGVKYKGNSTYKSNQVKNPFHIELDTYKDHIYEAYTDIKLSNVANDPSFVREVLSYQILRQYMAAPLSNYANVYVNGTLIGLYSNSEAVSKKFLTSRFESKKNTFIKCNPIDGAGPQATDLPNLVYHGQDSADYIKAYELKSDGGWQGLIDLTDSLKNNITNIDKILDVDKALWMLAFDNVLVNLDSYIGAFAQNYYLYKDDNDRFLSIVWDLNEGFGRFSMTGSSNLNNTTAKQQMSHLLNITDTDYPLNQKLLSIPMYKRMYLAHCKTILLENFDNNSYFTTGQTLQTTIDAAVQADPNKFFTYANFTSNLTSDITGGGPPPGNQATPGIASLMNGRSSYILGLSDFTQTEPTITNENVSNSAPTINDQLIFTCKIKDADSVYVGYRTELTGVFTRIKMYNDGTHGDNIPGDSTHSLEVQMSNTSLQYYFYAENSGIGKFSPVRAEHEYYLIETTPPAVWDVAINEVMASNNKTESDQNGEYDDWIELYNNTKASVNLSGYSLTDNPADITQWQFPSGTFIAANGYLIIWCDNDTTQLGLHANFKISSSGESIFFSDANKFLRDQVSFSNQTTDVSYGRYPNGTGDFKMMLATPVAENSNLSSIENKNIEDGLSFVVFPNPASKLFTILLKTNLDAVPITVYDVYGKQVFFKTTSSKLSVDVSHWSKGIYFGVVDNQSFKIIVQ